MTGNRCRTAKQTRDLWLGMPIECLPIPYALTDFGLVYVTQLRARELRFGLEFSGSHDDAREQVPGKGESRGHQSG